MKKKIIQIALALTVIFLAVMVVKQATHKAPPKPPVITPPRTAAVNISEAGSFVPATLKVKVNTVVIWTNYDTESPHRIAADPYPTHASLPSLDSKSNITFNGTYRYKFDKTGTYHYHDELHPDHTGTIVVE